MVLSNEGSQRVKGHPGLWTVHTVSQARKAPLPRARLVISFMAKRVQLSPVITLQ